MLSRDLNLQNYYDIQGDLVFKNLHRVMNSCITATDGEVVQIEIYIIYMSPAEWSRQAEWIKIANIHFFKTL